MMAAVCWSCEVTQKWESGKLQNCWNCGRFMQGPKSRTALETERCRKQG